MSQVRLEADITALQSSDLEVKGMLLKMEESETLDVDKAVVTTAPLYRQLVRLLFQECISQGWTTVHALLLVSF